MKGQDKGKKKYDVTLFPEVSVRVLGVEAGSQAEAIRVAYERVGWRELFEQIQLPGGVEHVAFQDGFSCALVDEEDDLDQVFSRWYSADGQSVLPSGGLLILAELLQECLADHVLDEDLKCRIFTALARQCSNLRTYKIYFVKSRDVFPGRLLDGIWSPPSPADLDQTHVMVARIEAASLSHAFRRMQSDRWSPRGQADVLLAAQVEDHGASMTVGDVIEAPNGRFFWTVGYASFVPFRE